MSTSAGDNAIGQAPQLASASAELAPMTRPMSPPVRQSVTASIKNCERMSRRRAPTAMRKPISLVRSVTDTSMMFMIPMPPTMSEMAAVAMLRTWKSSVAPGRT